MYSKIAKVRVGDVVKPDSITTYEGDFLATHVPLKNLQILDKFDLDPSGGKHVTEEYVYNNYVLNPDDRHQFIAVYGVSGTGKSHLIRWLDTKFENDKKSDEVILFVRRSDNTLKGTIRQLLEVDEIRDLANKDIYERLSKASEVIDEKKLKDLIYHYLIVEIQNDTTETLNNVKRKRLVAFLQNGDVQDQMFLPDGPIDRIYSKIDETNTLVDKDTVAEFKPEDFFVDQDLLDKVQNGDKKARNLAKQLSGEIGIENSEKMAIYINQFIDTVVQRCAGVEPGDFEQMFKEIRKELFKRNKKLTIFIEDITSFTGVDDALLNALMVPHTGDYEKDQMCRISSFVGSTSNYLQYNFKDNHKNRIDKCIYLPPEAFDQNGLFEFVGRYINTMSLSQETLQQWLDNNARNDDYPIAELDEKEGYDYVTIEGNKKLSLFPLNKMSILNMYETLKKGQHQTPRYIIQDIIAKTVNEYLFNFDQFPSEAFVLNTAVNGTLTYNLNTQIKNNAELVERLIRFLSIWGNGKEEISEMNGIKYISGIDSRLFDQFGLPKVNFEVVHVNPVYTRDDEHEIEPNLVLTPEPVISQDSETLEKINNANRELTKWLNGEIIKATETSGVSGILRNAKDDLLKFVYDTIDWQANGISLDAQKKFKDGQQKSLIIFENQDRGNGYFILTANRESVDLIMALIRKRLLGKNTWNYEKSYFDAYLLTNWLTKYKNEIIEIVNDQNKNGRSTYIEAAIAYKMYYLALNGNYNINSIRGYKAENVYMPASNVVSDSPHSPSWNKLVDFVTNKKRLDAINTTITDYFRFYQGKNASKKTINRTKLEKAISTVKKNSLIVSEDDIEKEAVKARKDICTHYTDLTSRIGDVVLAEREYTNKYLNNIYDLLDDDEIDDEIIDDICDDIDSFYSAAASALININTKSTKEIRKNKVSIANAIEQADKLQNEKNTLKLLFGYSNDTLKHLIEFNDFLVQVKQDLDHSKNKIAAELEKLRNDKAAMQNTDYKTEQQLIDSAIEIMNKLREE